MCLLFMARKWLRGGICQAIHRYAKANNKYMKNYDKNISKVSNVSKASCKWFWMGRRAILIQKRLYKKLWWT